MPRKNIFAEVSPEKLKDQNVPTDDLYPIIWNAFARAHWLHKYFAYTPNFGVDNSDQII